MRAQRREQERHEEVSMVWSGSVGGTVGWDGLGQEEGLEEKRGTQ